MNDSITTTQTNEKTIDKASNSAISLGLDVHTKKYIKIQRALRLAREKCKNSSESHIFHSQYKYKCYWMSLAYDDMEDDETDDDESVGSNQYLRATQSREDMLLHAMYQRTEKLLRTILTPNDFNIPIGIKKRSLLQIAVIRCDYAKVILLLKSGVYVDYRDKDGKTALMLSMTAPSPHNAAHIFEALLNAGADVNKCDVHGRNAFHRGCQLYSTEIETEREKDTENKKTVHREVYTRFLRRLLSEGVYVDVMDSAGNLPVDIVKSKRSRYNVDQMLSQSLVTCREISSTVFSERKLQHTRMWARIISRQFMSSVFRALLRPCAKCKRQEKDCQALKRNRYKYWLFVHSKFPR